MHFNVCRDAPFSYRMKFRSGHIHVIVFKLPARSLSNRDIHDTRHCTVAVIYPGLQFRTAGPQRQIDVRDEGRTVRRFMRGADFPSSDFCSWTGTSFH